MLQMNKFNTKRTWLCLRTAIRKRNNKPYFPITFKVSNIQLSNKMKIAESFNNYLPTLGKLPVKISVSYAN